MLLLGQIDDAEATFAGETQQPSIQNPSGILGLLLNLVIVLAHKTLSVFPRPRSPPTTGRARGGGGLPRCTQSAIFHLGRRPQI